HAVGRQAWLIKRLAGEGVNSYCAGFCFGKNSRVGLFRGRSTVETSGSRHQRRRPAPFRHEGERLFLWPGTRTDSMPKAKSSRKGSIAKFAIASWANIW